MPLKVILATDGSEGARKAALFTRDLFRSRPGVEVIILHVVSSFQHLMTPSHELGLARWSELLREMEQAARAKAREFMREIEELFGEETRTTVMVTVGDPASEIVHLAKEEKADLVILGSRGLGQVQSLLLGSVSDRVVHLAPCPVLVVR